MQFIADAMLGRLARWLRFLGFDTLYYPGIDDAKLIRIARENNRFILTRDTRLVQRKGLRNVLLIHANDSLHQLVEVVTSLKLKQFDTLSRCVSCNGQLVKIREKDTVRDMVPEYVFLNRDAFFKCTECDKIYWEGSHPKKFRENLHHIFTMR